MNVSAATSVPVLEMRGVAVGALRDPDAVMISDVNWSVNRGEFWVVGGLQGSGKTDLALLAAGLMPPLSGTYRFNNEPMPMFDENRLAERLKLGLVFDGGQLLNHLTVSENIALPLRYHRDLSPAESRDEVRRLLDLMDLSAFADNTPGAIGRTWQQRVGLARTLILRPEVVIMDNPLGGLDLRHRSWWLNFLGELAAGPAWYGSTPMTLLVTTDDLRIWRNRGHQFAIIKDKRLEVLGAWSEVERSMDQQVREFMTSAQHSV
ncbi:MAG TPA: ATP-binding cassette domain-containing protein [Verrucomicrobiae bacterium]|nr:ATP-binding cassette domain-containing protein [Verrucomicrobiae bacterium]